MQYQVAFNLKNYTNNFINKFYYNLLDTFEYSSKIDIVNFLTNYCTDNEMILWYKN